MYTPNGPTELYRIYEFPNILFIQNLCTVQSEHFRFFVVDCSSLSFCRSATKRAMSLSSGFVPNGSFNKPAFVSASLSLMSFRSAQSRAWFCTASSTTLLAYAYLEHSLIVLILFLCVDHHQIPHRNLKTQCFETPGLVCLRRLCLHFGLTVCFVNLIRTISRFQCSQFENLVLQRCPGRPRPSNEQRAHDTSPVVLSSSCPQGHIFEVLISSSRIVSKALMAQLSKNALLRDGDVAAHGWSVSRVLNSHGWSVTRGGRMGSACVLDIHLDGSTVTAASCSNTSRRRKSTSPIRLLR